MKRKGAERASKGLGHQQCLPIWREADTIRVLEVSGNSTEQLPRSRGIVHVALAFCRGIHRFRILWVTMDGVSEVEIAGVIEDEVIDCAQALAITGVVEPLHVPVCVDPFDPSRLVVLCRADRATVAPE